MRSVYLLAATIAFTAGSAAAVGGSASITGEWSRTDGASRISVAPCGEQICAVNTWIRDTSNGEAVGDKLVMNLQPQEPAKLTGEAFDEKRKLRYSMEILVADNAMTTQGCMLSGVVCKTLHWNRLR
ncbi:DUF2147 domain-containing protein [soil metagenome]